jgi:hypothetical protein
MQAGQQPVASRTWCHRKHDVLLLIFGTIGLKVTHNSTRHGQTCQPASHCCLAALTSACKGEVFMPAHWSHDWYEIKNRLNHWAGSYCSWWHWLVDWRPCGCGAESCRYGTRAGMHAHAAHGSQIVNMALQNIRHPHTSLQAAQTPLHMCKRTCRQAICTPGS